MRFCLRDVVDLIRGYSDSIPFHSAVDYDVYSVRVFLSSYQGALSSCPLPSCWLIINIMSAASANRPKAETVIAHSICISRRRHWACSLPPFSHSLTTNTGDIRSQSLRPHVQTGVGELAVLVLNRHIIVSVKQSPLEDGHSAQSARLVIKLSLQSTHNLLLLFRSTQLDLEARKRD